MPDYLKLQTVNANIPSLVHMHTYPHSIHPVQMFDVLARFAGHLCVFKVGEHPRDLPIYRHDDLSSVFVPLIAKLRVLLEFFELRRYVRITLRRLDESRYDGDITDPELFTTSDFYFGVEAEVSENRIVSEFPKYAKVISPDMISRLIGNAIPGANLIWMQNPPAALPRKAGKVYFRIDPRGDRWEHIKRAAQIAIYVPAQEFPSLDIECLAVQK
jgi:type VI secretion system protein ImpJ